MEQQAASSFEPLFQVEVGIALTTGVKIRLAHLKEGD